MYRSKNQAAGAFIRDSYLECGDESTPAPGTPPVAASVFGELSPQSTTGTSRRLRQVADDQSADRSAHSKVTAGSGRGTHQRR